MPLLRPKQVTIYPLVHDWWNNAGGVDYVAHAVTATGVTRMGDVQSGEGGTPTNHPDQVFWRGANRTAWPARATVVRIEIDCSLKPCSDAQNCCLLVVPRWLNDNGYANTRLRIFSHRYEGGDAMKNKRVFNCNTGGSEMALRAAFAADDNWFWCDSSDPRINNQAYHGF
jgi:hypothetical protein